ncbi:hypothetical protein [Polaribacter sp. 20A6]|uniref:hypothetical protein n=1 Tax=Polaribacter sp. 20A6 TaxID=2687289 RepID=UPI0013FD5BB4|nr:hypothetical protein [Polaribacter sp. 20A6]
MKGRGKTEKQKILDIGSFGTYNKPFAINMGMDAALVLNLLIDKYDYWVEEKGEFKNYGKYKAFYITYKDLSENGEIVSMSKLNRKSGNNPLEILEKAKLIKRYHEWNNLKRVIYYVLFFENIIKAFEDSLTNLKEKRRIEGEVMKSKKIEQDKERGGEIDNFLKEYGLEGQKSLNLSDSKKLQNNSTETIRKAASKLQKTPITKNRKTKNEKKKKKLTKEEGDNAVENDFSEEELDRMVNHEKYGEVNIYNCDESKDDDFDTNLLYDMIFETRRGFKSVECFFDFIVNVVLKEEFNGFRMSSEDGLLIYEAIVNNPMFKLEDEDIEERDEEMEYLKSQNKDELEENLECMVDLNEERYEHLYNDLCEKIRKNCLRIKKGKLKARFGNIFVGVKEFSENYEPHMKRYY